MESIEYPILVEGGRGRKRKRDDKNTKKAMLKIERWRSNNFQNFAKLNLVSFYRFKPKSLPVKPSCAHSSRKYECKFLSNLEIMNFAKGFYQSKNKMSQDAFILTYCYITTPKRNDRHLRNGPRKQISINFRIRKRNGKLVKVCQKAFCGFLTIGKDRVQRVCKRHLENP